MIALVPISAYAQSTQPYSIVKGERNEIFKLPYGAANHDRSNPVVYTYDSPVGNNWIMGIENKLEYTAKEDAKVMMVLREEPPSEKYIQVAMYGGETKRYSVWINQPEIGYLEIYRSNERGWSTVQPAGITHAENAGLTMSDGTRIVVDRLGVGGFNLASIEVYGNDEPGLTANTYAGELSINLAFGSIAGTPISYVPFVVMAVVGGTVGILLLLKKRKQT